MEHAPKDKSEPPRALKQSRSHDDLLRRQCLFWKGITNLALTTWPNINYVKCVTLGDTHTAILTHGKVYCFGSNEFGQLGNGTYTSTIEPTEVKALTGLNPDHVAVGSRHTVCSTRDGAVYCWGDSSKGQCGTGELVVYTLPVLVQEFNVVMRRIGCCSTATVCLTTGGTVFVWGSGATLGRPRLDMLVKPMQLTFLDARRVVDVACGADFCVAVAEKLAPVVRRFAQKNNYVVVHSGSRSSTSSSRRGEQETVLATDDELLREAPAAPPPAVRTCPLGLELAEEHVYLCTDEPESAAGQQAVAAAARVDHKVNYFKDSGGRLNSPSDITHTRSKSMQASSDKTLPDLVLTEIHSDGDRRVLNDLSRPARAPSANAIVADQDAAMAYLKKQLGEVAVSDISRDSATASASSQSVETSDVSRHGGPHLSRLVSTGISSAAAVMGGISSIIQDSFSKLPLLDRLGSTSAEPNSIALLPDAGSSTPNGTMSVSGDTENDGLSGTKDSADFSPSAVRLKSEVPSSEHTSLSRIPDYSEFSSELQVSLNTEVCSWGKGDFGQLGHGDTLDRSQPCFITSLNDENVVSVSAGSRHVLALTADGRVFGWGDNMYDQLGLRKKQYILEPQLLEIVQLPVSKIAAGERHSLFLHDHPRDTRPCLFYTGRDGGSSGSTVGARLSFVDTSGIVSDVFAGASCDCCSVVNTSPSAIDVCFEELKMSERDFYKRFTDITKIVVKTILDSDVFTVLEKSPYGGAWRDVVTNLYGLADAVGTNVQLLARVASGSALAAMVSKVFFSDSYLQHFEKYSVSYHNFMALDGIAYLIGTSSAVLRGVREQLASLLESCRLEGDVDDMLACIAVLLQFPLRRISEYRFALEKMSLALDNSEVLSGALSALSNMEAFLTAEYNSAQITQIFWEKCTEKLAGALKTSGRRIVTDSKAVPLQLNGAAKMSSHWFILFNDTFVHVQSTMHRCYPLVTTWIEQASEDDPIKLGMRLVMPEEIIVLQATNPTERAEWILRLHEAINQCCHRRREPFLKKDFSTTADGKLHSKVLPRPATAFRRVGSATTPRSLGLSPSIRHATYTFTKPGRLCGATYTGTWRNGKPCGDGEILYADGSKYRGKLRDGEHYGYGVCWLKPGAAGGEELLQGEWKDGKLDGYGSVRYATGDTYEGLFKDGLRHGHGVMKSGSARTPGLWSVYVGEWRADRRHGYGVLDDSSRGEKYLGQWVDDARTGSGLLVALDGSYCEGSFVAGKLLGTGLMLTSDGTCYEGQFAGGAEINGKGRLTFPNGDHMDGQFSGSFGGGLKVSGVFCKPQDSDMERDVFLQHSPPARHLPRAFGKYSVPAERKWEELFRYTRAVLGSVDDRPVPVDKAWENVAVRLVASSSRQRQQSAECRMQQHQEDLEKIPSRSDAKSLTREHYVDIQAYLHKACDSSCHPLGQLVRSLVDVYRATYLGAGAQPHLLLHAKEEVKSVMRRLYDVIRILFPELPENGGPSLVSPTKCDDRETYSSTSVTGEEASVFSIASLKMEDGEVVSWSLLLHPIFLPKVYPPLFSLYALQNEAEDDKYWHRVERFNKQSDFALMAYLGVHEKFWLLSDEASSNLDERLSLARDKCYLAPIEVLQQLTTAFTPAEKLQVVQQTFTEVNKLVKHHLGERFVWTMDDLFPVFQFVVIRARLRHLGAEINFTADLMDRHLEHGELGLMFTTIKACHFQIQTEKLL